MVRAMETIARSLNNETDFMYWLMYGVADGDINDKTKDEDLEFYIEDENFADLMYRFLRTLGIKPKEANGMLYCDRILSKENVPPQGETTMKKATLFEIIETFRNYNEQHYVQYGKKTNVAKITAVIVYKQSNFAKPYSEIERSYRINNLSGKIFFNKILGKSMIGDSLDGTDLNVRLDIYMWEIDYCYFEQ